MTLLSKPVLLTVLLTVQILSLACAIPEPTPGPLLPQPEQALREASLRGPVPEEARVADYRLEGRLDTESHEIEGRAVLRWRNRTSRTVEQLPFHLYMNGFRAEDTVWMKGAGGGRFDSIGEKDEWGYIDVRSVRLLSPGEAVEATDQSLREPAFREPAQGASAPQDLVFREDSEPSTMTVELPAPVGPGEEIEVELRFLTRLPRVIARTGYVGEFYAVAQWYPKIGVLEEEGWSNHTFTHHSEFYADFGNYDVLLDLPSDMVVGSTGIQVGEEDLGEGRRRLHFRAEMVHDFALFGDPRFVESHGEHRGVWIRQLMLPERLSDAPYHLEMMEMALDSYESRYGAYPWSTLTLVHTPKDAGRAAGMEYPTLFTTTGRWNGAPWLVEERITGVHTSLHEFGHQYFQGLLAFDESAEPWLDEGLNTFTNGLTYVDGWGEDFWISRTLGQEFRGLDLLRLTQRRPWSYPMSQSAADFHPAVGAYGATVYMNVAATFFTLRNVLGAEPFDRAFRVFCDRGRFAHPTGQDLVDTFLEVLGPHPEVAGSDPEAPTTLDLAEFFDRALNSTDRLGYRVGRVFSRRALGSSGWQRDESGQLVGGELPDNLDLTLDELPPDQVVGMVTVERTGELAVPVELEIETVDGEVESLFWDGRERTKVFEFPGKHLRRARLDPQERLLMDWQELDDGAWADDQEEEDGLSGPLSRLIEATSLTLFAGGLGP